MDYLIIDNKSSNNLPLKNKVYQFWKQTWGVAFKEQNLQGIDTNFSDDFFHADEVGTLIYENQPVAVILYNSYNLEDQSHQDLKYFNKFPREELNRFKNNYRSLASISYLAVKKEFRKANLNSTPFSRLLMGLSVKKFQFEGKDDCLVGMPLLSRGVNNICSLLGMKAINSKTEIIKYSVPVQYMYIEKNDFSHVPFQAEVDSLFLSRNFAEEELTRDQLAS